MSKIITKKLIKIRGDIKAKLNAIKTGHLHAEQVLEPLKHFISKSITPNVKHEPVKKEEVEIKTPIKKEEVEIKTPIKKRESATSPMRQQHLTPREDIYGYDPAEDSYFYDESFRTEPTQTLVHTIPEESLLDYLDQYDELPQKYISGHIRDTEYEYDHHYLKHDLETDKIHFGDSLLDFKGPDIVIKDKIYHGTPGLYELIFKNKVNEDLVTNEDRKNFGEILMATNAHKRNFNAAEQTAGNRGDKYRFVIKPILSTISKDLSQKEQLHKSTLRSYRGQGLLMQYNNKPIEYVHWDDPNELVERLKLLIASQVSGNNNHNNEINSIIEELRESDIIE